MDVKWSALGQVLVVSLAVSVVVVVVFSLGVTALSARRTVRETGSGGAGALAAATLCFAACAAVVLYGIYLIVPQFH
ncbi:hypothetical protein MF672_024885 [Actinomadura sp. ATCC 31491]|uniref:DUF4190 domain-containing protein n=1 Tax=Actinomadura luzonensis TaxID=2805427 RepID=A0ABT0FYN6_9ACTN|nr:hypothetical protein [Actinomadura luzonensis]MCK2217003.1 hypothetical protein [Actinomadura luzonensis]